MRASSRIPLGFWIALIVAIPLAVLFLLSLAAAAAITALIGAVYWLLAPRRAPISSRSAETRSVEIELDPGDYRRLPDERERG
jgi:hypothetical protein